MKAFVLAAGLGTRLKPWTLSHPKALVPVGGVPMLQRVILSLREQGCDDITVNVHHFGDQIIDFVRTHDFGVTVRISDERDKLLDTGGALLKARPLLRPEDGPVLVHNVDILGNADLKALMAAHESSHNAATLLVSGRQSSRRLLFDIDMNLRGWSNESTGELRPAGIVPANDWLSLAFSGIYVMSAAAFDEAASLMERDAFPIMDYLLSPRRSAPVSGYMQDNLELIDIGKPHTLAQANLINDNAGRGTATDACCCC